MRRRSCEAAGMAWDFSTGAELAAHLDWLAGAEEQKERFAWLLEAVTSKD